MRKSLITLAVTAALVISNITPAFAAYIVEPTDEQAEGTYEGFIWYQEEKQRWEDRLINTYAENIKATTPENSAERFSAVIKAVADYNPTIAGTYDTMPTEYYAFKDGALGSDTMTDYVYILGGAVGLNMRGIAGTHHDMPMHVTVCDINGVIYWGDAWMYDSTNDSQWLASTSQLSFFETVDQRADRIAREEANIQYGESFTSENGQTFTCVN